MAAPIGWFLGIFILLLSQALGEKRREMGFECKN